MTDFPARFRTAMLAAIDDPDRPLMLSGGVDSASVLAAQLAHGGRPHCYTFRLGDYDSSDVSVPRSMTETFSLPWTLVSIPHTDQALLSDIQRLIALLETTTKTHIQCSQPWLYLAPAVVAHGATTAYFAMAAGKLWETSRGVMSYWKREGEDWARMKRRSHIDNRAVSDFSVIKTAEAAGLQLIDAFRSPGVIDVMLDATFSDLHRPQQKYIALAAFPEFWQRGRWYRPGNSLQVISGIRAWHDTLLTFRNPQGAKVVKSIYRDMQEHGSLERSVR